MSLVGTRPILQDELQKYELHHRARIAIKPGITGMWQVSGRSDITDFEEVVRLDTEYISNWNFGLDTENVYFSKKIEEEIKNNKMIEKLSQEANGLPRFGHLSADNMFGIGYEAVKPEDIPNFLDESWAIKEEESTDGEE